MDLYKDKKYVKLITETIDKLTEGYKNKAFFERVSGNTGKAKRIHLNKTLYNRVYNALITQPNKEFVETIEKALKNNTPIAQLAQQLKTKEDTLLGENKPFLGTEGHHIFHQNTVQRIRKFSVAQQLEILHKFRKLGGTSGVVPGNLTYLSRMAHRANLLKDAVKEVTAHINPFTLRDDTGYWSDDYDFDPERLNLDDLDPEKLSLDDIADALHNEAYGPQKMLAGYAGNRKSQVKAKKWFQELLGGTDLFDPKLPASVLNKYKKILSNYGIPDFGVVSEAFEKGEVPKLPIDLIDEGEIFSEIEALNKQFQESGLIPKIASKGGIGKKLIKIGAATTFGTIGVAFDALATQQGLSEVKKEKGLGKKIVGGLRATSGITGLASVTPAAPLAVPASFLSGVTAEILNTSLDYHAEGGRKRGDSSFSLIGEIPGTKSYDKYVKVGLDEEEENDY